MKKDRAYFQARLDDNVVKATVELVTAQRTFRANIAKRPVKNGRLITEEEAARSALGRRQQYGRLARAIRLAEDYRAGGRG